MKILSLTDNLCALPGCKAQHGLSLYIKTQKHKDDPYALIVFDTDNYGFFTAEKLLERHRGLNLIMISGSEQYAVDAFRLHVSDFWLYPYAAENVEEAFRDLRHTPEKGSQFCKTKI